MQSLHVFLLRRDFIMLSTRWFRLYATNLGQDCAMLNTSAFSFAGNAKGRALGACSRFGHLDGYAIVLSLSAAMKSTGLFTDGRLRATSKPMIRYNGRQRLYRPSGRLKRPFCLCSYNQNGTERKFLPAKIHTFWRTGLAAVCVLVQVLSWPVRCAAYSVLSHEAIIDSAWDTNIKPVLLQRFPHATPDELRQAHGYAYGGAIIQDLGYYPHGSVFFSDLSHYVRSGDFVIALLRDARESNDLNDYAFALGALSHYAADIAGHPIATNRAVPSAITQNRPLIIT